MKLTKKKIFSLFISLLFINTFVGNLVLIFMQLYFSI